MIGYNFIIQTIFTKVQILELPWDTRTVDPSQNNFVLKAKTILIFY